MDGETPMNVQNPYCGYRKNRARTYALWEKFHAGILTSPNDVPDPYHRLLLQEWQQCAQLGIEPAMKRGRPSGEEEFRKRLQDNKELLDKAIPAINRVSSYLFEVPGILLVTDSDGVVLSICGDERVRALAAEGPMVIEGTCWRESVAGSNGIGSAINKRAPVHVYSSEHYCEGWHHWTCAGAPILAPWNDDVVGVIDFTTIEKDYRDQAVGLAFSLANAVQSELRLEYEMERSFLRQRFQEFAGHYRSDNLLIVDRRGKPLRWSATAEAENLASHPIVGRDQIPEGCESLDILMPGDNGKRIGTLFVMRPSSGATIRQ